ncbi:MAG TPA: helix-turn-helix transcriptional regulator [Dehalococcoidia bacterium]|jgi:PadR family transcriptional regulator PadR|nr:helix-turn-helix transcriptional regulator [Dehalococcoidia bacterium]
MRGETLKGHLDLLLLAVLAGGPAHGYAIITALKDRSSGVFDLPEGTIYPALHRLERAGLLDSHWALAAGRSRRIYELSPAGREALRTQRDDWQRFARAIHAVVQGSA